ncbi:P-loop containing nucleoside triphosphate hydrolase [Artemisia annua]|uniref:P-loop containing nucleoside triphosphate hydrolase n=1 Tax=Artemisia annua TaxID=35608 RepID=A0A2U1PAL5_ARTAN|nr:P-loop containing nucleoside triphosphate hydrolase [Artemisia annua]
MTQTHQQNDQEPNTRFCWWKTVPDFTSLKTSSSPSCLSIVKVLREMERLCSISEHGLDELKHKLMVYKAGDFWLPIGGLKKENMDIPSEVTVLLVGLSGSGKSSLVNLMYGVLGRSGLIPFSQTSNESSKYSTMILEEHNVLRSTRNGFCVYDSRGLDFTRMGECLDEVTRWITDGVRHNEPCLFGEDVVDTSLNCSSDGFVRRKVNYVVVVVDLTDVYKAFFCGGDFKRVLAIKSLFHCPSIRTSNADPLLILTHGDMLKPMERLNCRIKICSYLGIPVTTGVYDIVCLSEQGILPEEADPVTCFALTEAIYRAILQSDRTHSPKKTWKDCFVDILSRVMCSLAYFFAMLSRVFQEWGDKNKIVELTKVSLRKNR